MKPLDPLSQQVIAASSDGDRPTEAAKDRMRARVLATAVGAGVSTAGGSSAGSASAKTAAASAMASKGAAYGAAVVAQGSILTVVANAVAVLAIVGVGAAATYMVGTSAGRERLLGRRGVTTASARSRIDGEARDSRSAPAAFASPPTLAPSPAPSSAPTAVERGGGATPPPPAARAVSAAPEPGGTRADPPGEGSDPLGGEAAELDAALVALRDGHPDLALALLDGGDRRSPQGALVEERAMARIDALCMLGRTREAEQASARFLADRPRSPLASRAARACTASPGRAPR